jgi:anti-anti-sigma factor
MCLNPPRVRTTAESNSFSGWDPAMFVKTSIKDSVFEARISERLSFADNGLFRKLLEDMVASKTGHWVLDVSALTSLDSAGLGMFIIAMENAKKAGSTLILRSPTEHVRKLIELSKMDKLIKVEN